MNNENEKENALKLAIAQVEKDFGKGSVMRLGDRKVNLNVVVIPTGIFSLDIALGVGGFPRGRIVEIFGPEGGGKTTLALEAIASAQKQGGKALFVDVEHAFFPEYAKNLGVNIDELIVSQPDYAEQALEIIDTFVRSGAIDVCALDSVAALVPKTELEGDMGDSFMGVQARLMSQALRKLSGSISKSKTCMIFINQLREKIGVVFGNPEVTPGGRALKFYSSVRLDVRRVESISGEGNEQKGNRIRIRVVKNKVAPPYREAIVDLIYGQGISKEASLFDVAVDSGIIKKAGSYYSYGDVKLGQGRDNALELLKGNPDLLGKVGKEINEKFFKKTEEPEQQK
ncbi:MAG: recombinase RecA [Caldiserica bacterium CG02_land_8_20_14_3_00_36_38]|nr:recombinase RecA [Caldisericota bacterium]OIP13653.1 MAG: recombinase RecA [Caldisericum sp. CG2_30_36_11]PIP49715.1 MAG: recombinase RecA [Caldiserica bacterium CG23_combo_of_CG06-09_8_20_14_all_35_60]PIV56322.1 MAG: recombinase RecA [Caldiserica bacterium CG02_land_8_20_14_3_00_36_38]PIW11098.1 MAG: recombinase RecA [Caldiserica bacterium CG17_big_fil_post_rev_8_21_14_2_50_35_7]PIX28883.1 MAG: recombinase RecA [Caldiserica bacterium CG_4_8_14_3_um_filter_35_18]